MKTVTRNRFDGGVSDPRDTSTTKVTSIRNFLAYKKKLTPYRDSLTEAINTGTLTDFKLTDVIRYNYSGTTTDIFALSQKDASNAFPQIWKKSTVNIVTSTFTKTSSGVGVDGVVIPGSLIGFKGNFYCLKTKSGSVYLMKFVYDVSMTEIGAIGLSPTNGVVPQMFIHPKDGKLYMASGYTMGVLALDGTTLTTRDFSTECNINAITWQGNNIVMGQENKNAIGSMLAIWDGTTTSSALVDVIEFGSDTVMILDNLNDVVIGVSALSVGGASDVGTQNFVTIRGYAGGSSEILAKIPSVGTLGSRVYPFKAHRDSKVFFPMSAYLNGTQVHQIWAMYKNESGLWVVNPDRKVDNDTEITPLTITGFSMIGDYFWVGFSDGQFRRTSDQETYTATSIYETLINDGMEVDDRTKFKKLKGISVAKASNSGNIGQLVLKYSIDGGLNYVSIGTLTSGTKNVLKASTESNGKPFNDSYEYIFRVESTLGAEPIELKYSYDVMPNEPV